MKRVILRGNDFSVDYEICELVSHNITTNERFMTVKKKDGKEHKVTVGLFVKYDANTTLLLDTLTPKQQWNWLKNVQLIKI